MTEITDIPKSVLYPTYCAGSQLVDPTAFALAMVGGPVIVGILGAPFLLIPSFAVIFGGPIYLLIGLPVMLAYLRRYRATPGDWAFIAFACHLFLFTPTFLFAWLQDEHTDTVGLFLFLGSVFAPTWGAVSGLLYRRLENDFYKHSI